MHAEAEPVALLHSIEADLFPVAGDLAGVDERREADPLDRRPVVFRRHPDRVFILEAEFAEAADGVDATHVRQEVERYPMPGLIVRVAEADLAGDHVGLARDERHILAQVAIEPAEVVLRSEEHTSELQSLAYLVCRLLL